MSWNLGASSSWNPLGLSKPIMVLLYLYLYLYSRLLNSLRILQNFKFYVVVIPFFTHKSDGQIQFKPCMQDVHGPTFSHAIDNLCVFLFSLSTQLPEQHFTAKTQHILLNPYPFIIHDPIIFNNLTNTVEKARSNTLVSFNYTHQYMHIYHHDHHHYPPWIRSFDLFRHRRIAIVSWGVRSLFFLEVCRWGRVLGVCCCLFFRGGWSSFVCIWVSRLVFQRSLVLSLWLRFLFCAVLCIP